MKHSSDYPFLNALPDAPLDMPKQQLEYVRSLLDILRDTFSAFAGR